MVAWRLWWWAVVAPWPAAWVVRVVFVVVVVVVVAGARRALVLVPVRGVPMSLVLRLGFARVVRVVRGAVVWWVRRVLVRGMVADLVYVVEVKSTLELWRVERYLCSR